MVRVLLLTGGTGILKHGKSCITNMLIEKVRMVEEIITYEKNLIVMDEMNSDEEGFSFNKEDDFAMHNYVCLDESKNNDNWNCHEKNSIKAIVDETMSLVEIIEPRGYNDHFSKRKEELNYFLSMLKRKQSLSHGLERIKSENRRELLETDTKEQEDSLLNKKKERGKAMARRICPKRRTMALLVKRNTMRASKLRKILFNKVFQIALNKCCYRRQLNSLILLSKEKQKGIIRKVQECIRGNNTYLEKNCVLQI